MYMAYIGGWNPIAVFNEDPKKAMKEALQRKKKLYKDDLEKWTWELATEYYGGWCIPVDNGTVVEL